MRVNKLASIISGTLLALSTSNADAQQLRTYGGEELKRFIINYDGKDTVFFRNGQYKYDLIFDDYSKTYKYFRNDDEWNKKPTVVLDEKELKKALDYKNFVSRYANLDSAMFDITTQENMDLPSVIENQIKRYFEVALQYEPKAEAGSGQTLIGNARDYVVRCREAAKRLEETLPAQEKSRHDLEFAIKYMDKMLSDVSSATDLAPGIYKTSYNGIDLIVVSVNYKIDPNLPVNVREISRKNLFKYSSKYTDKEFGIERGSFEVLESRQDGQTVRAIAIYKGLLDKKGHDDRLTREVLNSLTQCRIDMDAYPQMKKF